MNQIMTTILCYKSRRELTFYKILDIISEYAHVSCNMIKGEKQAIIIC